MEAVEQTGPESLVRPISFGQLIREPNSHGSETDAKGQHDLHVSAAIERPTELSRQAAKTARTMDSSPSISTTPRARASPRLSAPAARPRT